MIELTWQFGARRPIEPIIAYYAKALSDRIHLRNLGDIITHGYVVGSHFDLGVSVF